MRTIGQYLAQLQGEMTEDDVERQHRLLVAYREVQRDALHAHLREDGVSTAMYFPAIEFRALGPCNDIECMFMIHVLEHGLRRANKVRERFVSKYGMWPFKTDEA